MKKHLDLYVVNGMYWVTAAAFLPFIGAYYTSIGMTDGQVGILAAVFPMAALVIQPFWAYLSDRTGKRKRMLLGLCAASGAAVSSGGFFLEMFFRHLSVRGFFYGAASPL